ncbi:MAG TPA: SUMF1/EgtB/PvdO family nonheme iron enzyme [Kofleriaceae bacterium]|jgi:formylglycine-generating enzyme required for sulfatase activity|nr:SUMF1/EgtB/PvdO family nonheme iron enzyme [Kofleriaceae bacterium]
MRSLVLVMAACSAGPTQAQKTTSARAAHAPLSLAADDRMIAIPAGRFIAGSTPEERATGYDDYFRTSGRDDARAHAWFDREADRHVATLPGFRIDLMPVTQAQFAEFTSAEHIAVPSIDQPEWQAQGLAQDFATQVARFVWVDGRPPDGREDHPVVLVPWVDADRYCTWRGALRGGKRRLPAADEFEKAARGEGGIAYPWGNTFEPDKLNSVVQGPGDTTPVGTYPAGASPYGVLDLAGNVFQWTATPGDDGKMVVKGSAWTEFAGIGRGASLAEFPRTTRHVTIGFRCAGDEE